MGERVSDALIEWREQIGVRLMLATRCTHEGDDFGPRAVCVTCFANGQSVGAILQAEAARAWDAGYLRAVEPESDIRDNPYRPPLPPHPAPRPRRRA